MPWKQMFLRHTLLLKGRHIQNFFYSLFASKEELVPYALRYQQPKLLRYAQKLMDDVKLSWREGSKPF